MGKKEKKKGIKLDVFRGHGDGMAAAAADHDAFDKLYTHSLTPWIPLKVHFYLPHNIVQKTSSSYINSRIC